MEPKSPRGNPKRGQVIFHGLEILAAVVLVVFAAASALTCLRYQPQCLTVVHLLACSACLQRAYVVWHSRWTPGEIESGLCRSTLVSQSYRKHNQGVGYLLADLLRN